MNELRIPVELRLSRAAARAEAAAAKCEKLAELLEMRLHTIDGEEVNCLQRIDTQDSAIIELAEIIGGGE